MTALKLIEIFDTERQNDVDVLLKKQWLAELDAKIVTELNKDRNGLTVIPFTADSDLSAKLNAPEPYYEIYTVYLNMKLDYMLCEIERYNNSAALFNRLYYELSNYISRTFKFSYNNSLKVELLNV